MSVLKIVLVIIAYSNIYDADPELMVDIAYKESHFRQEVINGTITGDGGLAVGLYQWHLDSWEYVRTAMELPTTDLRSDPVESIRTAAYAIGQLGLCSWWSTCEN